MSKIKFERKQYTIDATDKVLGRVASEVAQLLRGKNQVNFMPNMDMGHFVTVTNAANIKTTGNKMENKEYYSYTGYPGGIKSKQMKEIFANDPAKLLEMTIFNMLPKTRLRKGMLKRLVIKNYE